MNMFKPTKAKTPEEYIAMIGDESRRAEIQKLHEFIRKTSPSLKPVMVYGMIGYGPFHYRGKSGREGDWSLFALASQKNYISFYTCAVDGKEYVAEKYKKDFPKASIGRSCIRFKKLADIDLKVLTDVMKESEKYFKTMEMVVR